MEGTYPVMLDGAVIGTLEVRKEGAMTVFAAQCRMQEGIVRLSVYGEEGEGYLGILAPEDGQLTLRKRLSPTALRAFPQTIVEAGVAGRGHASIPVIPEVEETAREEAAPTETAHEAGSEAPSEAADEGPPGVEPGLNWYASPDGALVCFDGAENLVALPLGDSRVPGSGGGEPRTIEGREYLVFRGRGGAIRL